MQNQTATRTPNYKSPNGLSIYLTEEGHTLMASFAPQGVVEMISVDDFKSAIDREGFGECDLNEVAILEASSKFIAGESFEITIGDAVDGEFFIQIDDDHLNAFLTCIPGRGGCAVTPESVVEEARNKIISTELDMEAIERAINENGDHVLIAHGRQPEVGHDSEFKSLLPEAKEHVPQVDEDGVANFRDLGEILIVHAGDTLMRRIPATLGEPGITISGQPIPAMPGRDDPYSVKLEGVEIDPITEAGGSINANFTQNAVINAGQGIFIRDYTMMCKLTAVVQIIVGDGSRSGQIIGGVATAGMLVKAKTIGSPSRSRTVVISRTSDSLYSRMGKLSESRDDLKVRQVKLDKLIALARTEFSDSSEETEARLALVATSLNNEEQQLNLDEVQLKKEIVASRGAMIKAEQHFLEGVEVCVGTKRTTTVQDRSGGTYRLKDDELIFE